MKKLSNNGQSLVLFVVFIPFIIMFMAFIIDYGLLNFNANKLNMLNKMLVKTGLLNIDNEPKEKIIKLIKLNNIDNINYKININEEKKEVEILLNKEVDSFSYKLIKKESYNIKSKYKGYITNNKLVIERSIKDE